MNQPQDPRTAGRGDAGLLAFIVRDLMLAAGYEYNPDRPLIEQTRQVDTLIRHQRQQRLELERRLTEHHAHYDAELQRRDDLITELRKQLDGAIKLAERHGAQVEPWTFPEHTAPTPDITQGTPPTDPPAPWCLTLDDDRARQIRVWRVDERCTWGGVASAATEKWASHESNDPRLGRELCRMAAQILGEDYHLLPWSE